MLSKLIEIASAELGTAEVGQNIVKYNDWYWGDSYKSNGADYPWCVVFCAWICDQASVPFPHVAHCNQVESYAKSHTQWVTDAYRAGDFVIFDYNSDGNRDHIGFVVEANGDTLTTIEGNYGDKVSKVQRKASEVVGAYRPDYKGAVTVTEEAAPEPELATDTDVVCKLPVLRNGDFGEAVGSLQSLLRYHGYRMKNSFITITTPDCEFGGETEAALLDFCGSAQTTQDVWIKLIGGLG